MCTHGVLNQERGRAIFSNFHTLGFFLPPRQSPPADCQKECTFKATSISSIKSVDKAINLDVSPRKGANSHTDEGRNRECSIEY